MTDHYREAERLLNATVANDNPFPHLRPAELLAAAQVHATLATARPSVPPCTECGRTSPCDMDCLDKRIARHKAANEARENIPANMTPPSTSDQDLRGQIRQTVLDACGNDPVHAGLDTDAAGVADTVMSVVSPVLAERNEKVRQLREEAIENGERAAVEFGRFESTFAELESVRAELADLRSRAVVLPENWRDQIRGVVEPGDLTGPADVVALIESWSSPDSGDSKETAERFQSPAEIESPDSGKAEPGESHEQWCVWHGGPDPDNAAGLHLCDDEDHAREWLQWCQSELGSGIARRTVTCSPWVVVESPPASPESTEQPREPRVFPVGSPEPDDVDRVAATNGVMFRRYPALRLGSRRWQALANSGGDGQFYTWIEVNGDTVCDLLDMQVTEVLPESTEGAKQRCRCGSYEQMTPSGDYSPVPCPVHSKGGR